MPPDQPNKIRTRTLQQLLKAYHDAPSQSLQEQLVQLHMELVQKAILSLAINEQNLEQHSTQKADESLVEVGSCGLIKAIQEFNPDSDRAFNSFATPYILSYLKNYLQQTLRSGQTPPPYSQTFVQNHQSDNRDRHTSELVVKGEERTRAKSNKLESINSKNFAVDDSPSGPLKAETLQLLELYQNKPSAKLRNHLVHLNMGLVRKEAYHWSNQCTESYEDLLQVGSIGLIRAIERFDIHKGHAFSSFAVPYIRGEIQHYLRDKSPTMRIPRQWLVLYNQGAKVIQQLRHQLEREPLDREIAAKLDIELQEWQEIRLACQNRSPLSLDTLINDSDEGSASLGDLVPDSRYRSFQLAQEDSLRLHQALSHLEDRTREIVEFVFLKEFTHKEVAETLGISAVTVSRQVKKGLIVLRQIMMTPLD